MTRIKDVRRWRMEDCYMVICYHCGERFIAERYSACFCSSKCRVASHRQEKALQRLEEKASNAVWELTKSAGSGDAGIAALQRITKQVSQALHDAETARDFRTPVISSKS